MNNTLHLQHNVTPRTVKAILLGLFDDKSEDDIAESIGIRPSSLSKRIYPFLRQLAIMEDKENRLTNIGEAAAKLLLQNENSIGNIIHSITYSTFDLYPSRRFSWAYQFSVGALWERDNQPFDSDLRSRLVSSVITAASDRFQIEESDVAFSGNSILYVYNWLEHLDPPAIIPITGVQTKARAFIRHRLYTNPSMTLWAIGWLYRHTGTSFGQRLFVDQSRLLKFCHALFLSPECVDSTLSQAKAASNYERGGIFDTGFQGGFGRWVLLREDPSSKTGYIW